jgi:hypothetical protein
MSDNDLQQSMRGSSMKRAKVSGVRRNVVRSQRNARAMQMSPRSRERA